MALTAATWLEKMCMGFEGFLRDQIISLLSLPPEAREWRSGDHVGERGYRNLGKFGQQKNK